ncbi:hypothetical protein, partial [Enterococcus faecium]|uniref:hypothetical protein n=1 Tax=Enterococcus faecium TaxID=1352 RepID=UPI00352962D6
MQDRIKNGEYTYIINTTAGRQAIEDSKLIRRSALQYKVHYDTTLNGGFATVRTFRTASRMANIPTSSTPPQV